MSVCGIVLYFFVHSTSMILPARTFAKLGSKVRWVAKLCISSVRAPLSKGLRSRAHLSVRTYVPLLGNGGT